MDVLLGALVSIVAIYWLACLAAVVRAMQSVPRLGSLDPPALPWWPRVSLIVAARDEASEIEAALGSRLRDDYPDLEVIVVDDRSTDGTGAIAGAIAARDRRVVVERVETLPDGWLGKVHAMERGVRRARGEWLLFSDADVHWRPGTLKRAIAYLESERADHLSLLPEMRARSFFVGVLQSVFLRMVIAGGRLHAVADPCSSAAVGGGLFNLVRRSAFDRTPGFEWLRMEVIDDLALGQMLKDHGARARVLNAAGSVWLDFYPSVAEFVRGGDKNSFALVGGFNWVRHALVVVALLALELGAFVAIAWPSAPWTLRLFAAAALGLAACGGLLVNRWLGRRLAEVLLWPLGTLVVAFGAVRSCLITLARGGIEWRGTRYSTAALRAGRRLRFP
jgi:glycosyltransferase involved in cell wall biosynthesis